MPEDRPSLNVCLDDVVAVSRLMEGFGGPWWICGGWAIDLWLGRVTRRHEDLEIGVARADQGLLHDLVADWSLHKIVDEQILPWARRDWLALPVHQVVVRRQGASPPEFDFFLNELTDGRWRFRRNPRIHCPLREAVIRTAAGIPVLAPEVQLLHKAKYHRDKDEHDFHVVVPHLCHERRQWLAEALQQHAPGDQWIQWLGERM